MPVRDSRRVVERSAIKFQLAMVAMAALACSWVAATGLRAAGLMSLAWRWPLTIVAAYGAYVLLLRGWIALAGDFRIVEGPRSAGGEERTPNLLELAFECIPELEGLAFVLVLALAWWAGSVSISLLDLAVESAASCAIAARLTRRSRTQALVAHTWVPALLTVSGAFLLAVLAQQAFPAAATLREALAMAWRQ